MLTFGRCLVGQERPGTRDREEAHHQDGEERGKSPSVASLYRALAEVEQAAADDGLPIRPRQVRIRRPDDPLRSEEMKLRERLQAQVLQRSEDG